MFRLWFCILLHLYIELTLFSPECKTYTKKYSILYCFALHYDFRNTTNIKPSYCILFLNQTATYKSHQCSHSFLWTVLLCLRQFVFLVTLCYWDISVPTQNKSVSRQSWSGRVRSSNHFLPLYLNHFLIHLSVQQLHYLSWFLLSP